ncbi:MAG: flagellar basal body rod protein FlgB [Candidatus Neomarinimicrobiota bacterium]|nr:MAG: flagellar basal body rod protein FlgB [Candidatus Neomarinimicrobiota bacterium]
MKVNWFNTPAAQVFKEALSLYRRQFQAISENIANVNNPDYVRKPTDFSSTLEAAQQGSRIRTSSEKHIQSPHFYDPATVTTGDQTEKHVDLTQEMTALAENQVKYEFATRYLNRFYSGLSQAITGRTK